MHETDDIALSFFALQGPGAIEAHAGSFAAGAPHTPAMPYAAAMVTD